MEQFTLKDHRNNTKILQELLEGKSICPTNAENAMAPLAQANANDENNNNCPKNSRNKSEPQEELTQHPLDYFFVILDPDAEDIIQNVSDEMFFQCFQFDKVMVRCLLMELHHRTYYHPLDDDVNAEICFDMSVLATLSYLVNGHLEFIARLGYFYRYSEEVLRKCIEKTCETIVHFLSPVYVRFPCSPEEQQNVKSEFLRQFGVPGVVGVLECYSVRIRNVPERELPMYVSRRCPEPSVTMQVICDQNFRFLDVNPRFSGNTSNAYVWNRSHIKQIVQHSQEKDPNTWLIADRGYPLSSCVINPYRNVLNIQQESVNTALMEVHNVVDKSVGLLKGRFRCLNAPLPFSHKHAANVISSCVVLHNYLLAKNWPIAENLETIQLSKSNILKNAKYEDLFSPAGLWKRNFIKNFILNNSLQVLYKMRKNSNLNFINDSYHHDSMDY